MAVAMGSDENTHSHANHPAPLSNSSSSSSSSSTSSMSLELSSSVSSSMISTSTTASDKSYLRRLGSRSLTEEHSRGSTHSDSSVSDATAQRNSFPTRVPSTQATVTVMAHHGSDPILNDRHYAALRDRGDYVRMGWLTKQGHVWKNWKNRFFVLFHDGTLAYYKAKGKRRMKGCMKLNEGVVSVQFVDVRRANKPYVFQVEKGFYRMWCHCISQSEAELWVQALRGVREHKPPYFEPVLTLKEEQVGYRAVNTQLNKIFVTDERIQSMLAAFSSSVAPHDLQGTYDFIERLEDTIMNRYVGYLYSDPNVPLLSGNELLKFLRRHVEDRAFVPVAVYVYSNLNHIVAKSSRSRIAKSLKALKMIDSLKDFGVPDEVVEISSEWTMVRSIVDALDYMSLPSHKLDMVIHAGSTIIKRITEHLGSDYDVSDEILSAVFRYVLVHSSIDDLALVRALLSPIYLRHPACQNQSSLVTAFLDAIAWIEVYHQAHDEEPSMSDELSLASSRVVVSISTQDVGILFTTDGNGRGAIVHSVRKLSQAALSEVIVPGLALIGINDEPVLLMPFREICQRLRTAALPKKLTFMPEFFYYQLLSLDNEMYQYLFCLAASRGDRDSVSWFSGSQLDVNRPCSWEKTRGAQLFGCKLPDVGPIALHAAAAQGYFAMVDYLLRLGAHPNLQDKRGRCALHVLSTTTLDMVSIIEILKDNGADLNATDRQGITPLMEMARRGSLEGVTTLLALGARLDAVAWSTGYTALEYAVSVGATPVVELLLSKNADPNHLCLDGDTSLHLAAGLAHVEIIELLIKAGGNVSNLNRFSQTPAAVVVAQHAGSSTSIQECLDLLVSAGCDVGRPDILGRFLLHLAQLSNDDRIYDFLRQRFKSSEWDDEQVVDIYGCTAQDYIFDNRAGTELAHFHARDPRHMWDNQHPSQGNGSPRLHHHQHQHHNRTRSSSRSFHDLVHTLLHDVTVDLADLVAFSMFLESFSSLESLIDLLREYVSNGSTGRNVLRFVVVLLLFKLRHAKENDALQTEVFALIDRHRRLMAERGSVLLEDYKLMFERLFCLRGCPDKSPDEYTSIPIAMQQRYGLEHVQNFKTSFPHNLYVQLEPSQWAEHCTLLTHSLFCSIPVDDFVSVTNKSIPSRQYLSAKRWFQHLSAYVINAVLVEDYCEARAQVISFFLSAAECCLALRNYDTLAAILYALQSTAVQRLRRTMSCLPVETKKLLIQMQSLSDKGCREINKLMHAAASPSMPYIGLYLQSFVGLHELPVFEQGELVNGNRLRKLGELVVEILRRRSVAYELPFSKDVDMTLHVDLPYATDESRYARSLQLEPREAGAAPLGVRMMSMDPDGVDIDNEVRESIGSEGTFGIRQWFRMQKVVHRNRSRSSSQAASYEWV